RRPAPAAEPVAGAVASGRRGAHGPRRRGQRPVGLHQEERPAGRAGDPRRRQAQGRLRQGPLLHVRDEREAARSSGGGRVTNDPRTPFPDHPQPVPGETGRMDPRPDHGEDSYRGSGRLAGKAAIITGGDSGIGRAVAIAYAREGADLLISYLKEEDDAAETRWLV